MKKLMIAAAAAAMIGGVYAEDGNLYYDFSASVKTTVGKNQAYKTTTKTTTATYNLGWDGATFWYQDPGFTALPDYLKTTKKVSGNIVPCFKLDKKCQIAATNETDLINANTFLVGAAETYNLKSAGKWCQTVKIITTTSKTEGGCYRVAGTQKLTDVVSTDDCCTGTYTGSDGDAYNPTFQRFGALTFEKATKVEAWFEVGAAWDKDSYGLVGCGQGTWDAKLYKFADADDYTEGVCSVSGNVVGTLPAPQCEYCCTTPDPAVAFACDDDTPDGTLLTAAYGTFTFKFNKKATKNAEIQ